MFFSLHFIQISAVWNDSYKSAEDIHKAWDYLPNEWMYPKEKGPVEMKFRGEIDKSTISDLKNESDELKYVEQVNKRKINY